VTVQRPAFRVPTRYAGIVFSRSRPHRLDTAVDYLPLPRSALALNRSAMEPWDSMTSQALCEITSIDFIYGNNLPIQLQAP
jgi:hypothetical protein